MDKLMREISKANPSSTREGGLYSCGRNTLISGWDKLVKANQIIVKDNVITRCYLQEPGLLVIPEGIVEIGDGAFSQCSNLNEIQLPTSIEEIGHYAFKGCTDLKKLIVADLGLLQMIKVGK